MARVRTDNVFGVTTDNPLTAAATTLNSAGLANLAVVSSAEAILILDPNRVAGAPEIVVVTAHTGSATSATIVRAQFGTSAREHAAGTEWVHGPIASNATTFVTGADDQGDFVPMNAWETWAPTLTNMTLGNGSVIAKFVRSGRQVTLKFSFTLGSTSAMGSSPSFTLPVPTNTATWPDNHNLGISLMTDQSSVLHSGFVQVAASGTAALLRVMTAGGTYVNFAEITAAVPFAWAATHFISTTFTYEAAS